MREIIKNTNFNTLDTNIQDNLNILLTKINIIRKIWNKPMIVTSGLRTIDEHILIYKKKGILVDIPMKSKHLSGDACDIYDPNKELQNFILNNIRMLEDVGLWCEDFNYTPNWVHFQTIPPKSGKIFFIP